MRKKRGTRGLCLLPTALLLLALAPALARADTYTFLNTDDLAPTEVADTFGPANHYPSSIVVSGLSGTVAKATVTLIGFGSSSPDDIDMVIAGPNGQQVMLMSDACGEFPASLSNEDWTFDDSAPAFLSNNGPCDSSQASFKPSNYLGGAPEPDDLSPGGGPVPPYMNSLSFFNGATPDGAWNLFVTDDNATGYVGFDILAWALTLEVQPPPPTPPVATPATAPLTTRRATGRRAAALARCRKKKSRKARRRCRRRAKALPR
jgi:hypothetical protein